jgi:hypothetical protein
VSHIDIIPYVIGWYTYGNAYIPIIKLRVVLRNKEKVVRVYDLMKNVNFIVMTNEIEPSQEKQYLRFLLTVAENAKAIFPLSKKEWKIKHRSRDNGYTASIHDYFRVMWYIEELLQSKNALRFMIMTKYGYVIRWDMMPSY